MNLFLKKKREYRLIIYLIYFLRVISFYGLNNLFFYVSLYIDIWKIDKNFKRFKF